MNSSRDEKTEINLKINKRIKEIYTLKNNINRYSKKLIFEGLKIAKESQLDIKIKEVSEDQVDTTPLIDLTKDKYPSLYRKYNSLQEEYFEKLISLKSLSRRLNLCYPEITSSRQKR